MCVLFSFCNCVLQAYTRKRTLNMYVSHFPLYLRVYNMPLCDGCRGACDKFVARLRREFVAADVVCVYDASACERLEFAIDNFGKVQTLVCEPAGGFWFVAGGYAVGSDEFCAGSARFHAEYPWRASARAQHMLYCSLRCSLWELLRDVRHLPFVGLQP